MKKAIFNAWDSSIFWVGIWQLLKKYHKQKLMNYQYKVILSPNSFSSNTVFIFLEAQKSALKEDSLPLYDLKE